MKHTEAKLVERHEGPREQVCDILTGISKRAAQNCGLRRKQYEIESKILDRSGIVFTV